MKRVRMISIIVFAAFALWLISGIGSAQVACAHDPRFACSPRGDLNPINIPDAGKSWAYYGRLAPGSKDVYRFVLMQPLTVPMSLLIEAVDASNPARPALTVTDATGRTIATWSLSRGQRFREPFSGLDYFTTAERRERLTAGAYTATVTMQNGSVPQRYVFAIGEAEKFGVNEIPYVLGAVYRVKTRGY